MPLGVALTYGAAFLGGALWINSSLSGIRNELTSIRSEISQRFNRSDFEIWALKLQLNNTNIYVPDVNRK